MAPSGWVDVHGHFYLPVSDEERRHQIDGFRESKFMVPYGYKWDLNDTLAYMDKAGIQLQMLSYIPQDLSKLKQANDFAAEQVRKHPTRFGQLAALPTDDPDACLAEIERAVTELKADGFGVSGVYKGVYFSDPRLETVWQRLDDLHATVHVHPNAYAPPADDRPSPLIEVAFETARVGTDMIYRGLLKRYRNVKIILAHCGGALPVLSGRLALLGAEPWVPNPEGISKEDIQEQLGRLYVDTAATAETGLQPAVKMVGEGHVVYGADCGVPCSRMETMEENRRAVVEVAKALGVDAERIGRENAWALFPAAANRVERGGGHTVR